MDEKLRLSPWYLNTSRLHALTGAPIPAAAQRSLRENALDRVDAMRFALSVADSVLRSGKVPTLHEMLVEAKDGERFLATAWTVTTFRGAKAAVRQENEGKQVSRATFSAKIGMFEGEPWELSGNLLNQHFYSQSGPEFTSGRKRSLIMGEFEVSGRSLLVHPVIVGDMREDLGGIFQVSWINGLRLYPEVTDTFAKMRDVQRPSAAQAKVLLTIPEKTVKDAFASIVGEPFVDKDWGGEHSDLFTSALRVEGKNVSAAFIFKGPSVPGPLHPSKMGKNGDQLVRAFHEPADVVVIQHCNSIPTSVITLAEALAANPARPRKFCIIDGSDTYRILKAYGYLPHPEA